MTEAVAGEVAAASLTSLAEYGIGVFAIAGLLAIIYKFGMRWIDSAQKREERDAAIRKSTYEALNGITEALKSNTEAAKYQIEAMNRVSQSVGKLPCGQRDSSMRTRATDAVYAAK
jgi:hypothetical protein